MVSVLGRIVILHVTTAGHGPGPTAHIRGLVIRLRLADVLARRGWTPYRLARETGLTVPTAYRLADPNLRFGRFTADTLDRMCAALGVQPGDLLEWVPEFVAPRKPKAATARRAKKAALPRAKR